MLEVPEQRVVRGRVGVRDAGDGAGADGGVGGEAASAARACSTVTGAETWSWPPSHSRAM
ncbi:hypothetical protein [Streptomyces eurythermus]|uniref:hypothetical protein n=1 Tax=Streptomyces eurythermus TaxID=42237 RepID=UPI0033D84937